MSSSTTEAIIYFAYYAGFGIALALGLNTTKAKLLCNNTTEDIVRLVAIYFVYMAAYILLYPIMIHRLERNKYLRAIGVVLKVITQFNLLVHLALFYALGRADSCPSSVYDVLRVWFLLVCIVTLLIVARLLVSLLSYVFNSRDLESLFPSIQNPIIWVINEITSLSNSGKWPTFLTKFIYYVAFAVVFYLGLDKAHETFCYQPNFNYFKAATYYFIYMAAVTLIGHVTDLTGLKHDLDHNCLTRTIWAILFLPVQLTPIIYIALLKMSGRTDECSSVYDAVRIWFIFVCVICGALTARDVYNTLRHWSPERTEQPLLKHHDHHDHHAMLV